MVADASNTIKAFNDLITNHSGGGFFVQPTGITTELPYITAVTRGIDYKLFNVSIYNQKEDADSISMALLINPSDLTIGQTFMAADAFTRQGWLSTLWGRNQQTLVANLSTAAFYVYGIGLSSFMRNFSLSFKNFVTFVGIFKNNGYYFYKGLQNRDFFNSDPGRVINVLDQVKINYDGVDYLGSFSNLTTDENTEMPFRFAFNFEFIVSGLRGEKAEGHLRICDANGCNDSSAVTIRTQGIYSFNEIAQLDTSELTDIFSTSSNETDGVSDANDKTESTPAGVYSYTKNEKGVLADEGVQQAITEVAADLHINPQTLINLIHFESGWDAQALNKEGSGAQGLIQFTDATAMKLGFKSAADLIAQYPDAQSQLLGPVLKYLSQWKYTTNQSVYMAVFYPTARYVPPDTTFSSIVPASKYPRFARQNPGISTVQDYVNYVEGK
jgi:hypothetical protein